MLNTETQFSMACSVAVRWIVSTTIFLASLVAESFACSMMSLTKLEAFVWASSFNDATNCSRASSAVSFEIFSRIWIFCWLNLSNSSRRFFTWSNCAARSVRISSSSPSLRLIDSISLLRACSRCLIFCSLAMIWFFLRFASSSNSDFILRIFSFASRILSFLRFSAAISASFRMSLVFSSVSSCARLTFLL